MKDYYEVFDERGNKVAMKKDLKSAKEYVDNGGFKDSIEDDYNYDVETNFDKILYDLTANNIDYSSAAYDTQLIWFKDDTEYEKAKKYLDRKRWKYKESVNKKGVKYFEIKDAVKDKDYGGAFDLNPESYFSRDDLIDFEDELESKLGHKARTRAYVDGTTLSVDYELDGESYSTPAEVKIDMRKIKRPQDLIKHYLEPIRKIIEKEYKDWTSDSMKDAVEPEAKGQYKGYTIIAKSTGRANAPTLLEIYDGNKKVKSFFSADEDLDDAIHDVPKYWPLPPLPQKKYDMLSSYLNMISTFTSRDIDIKDVLRPLSGKGFKYSIDKIEGWIWKKGEMAYKNYYISLDGYKDKFIVTLYADPNQDWDTKEVNAYFTDSVKETKNEYPDEKQRLAVAYSYWERKGRDSMVKDAKQTFEIRWIDQYQKSKGYDKSFWLNVDTIKADTAAEALEKLKNIAVMRGTGTRYITIVNMKEGNNNYQLSGNVDEVIRRLNDSKPKDSIYSLTVQGEKSKKLVRAKDAREAIDKYTKMFPKHKVSSVKKTDKFNKIIGLIKR